MMSSSYLAAMGAEREVFLLGKMSPMLMGAVAVLMVNSPVEIG